MGRAGRCWDNPFSLPCSRGAQCSSSCCLPSPLCGPLSLWSGPVFQKPALWLRRCFSRQSPAPPGCPQQPPSQACLSSSQPTHSQGTVLSAHMGPHLSLGHGVGIVRVSAPEKHRRVGEDRGACWVQQGGPGTLVRTVPKPPPTDPTVASPAAHFVFLGHKPQLPIIALHLTHAGCWASKGRTSSWGTSEALGLGGFPGCSELLVPRALAASALFSLSFPIVYVSRVACVV